MVTGGKWYLDHIALKCEKKKEEAPPPRKRKAKKKDSQDSQAGRKPAAKEGKEGSKIPQPPASKKAPPKGAANKEEDKGDGTVYFVCQGWVESGKPTKLSAQTDPPPPPPEEEEELEEEQAEEEVAATPVPEPDPEDLKGEQPVEGTGKGSVWITGFMSQVHVHIGAWTQWLVLRIGLTLYVLNLSEKK